MDIFKAWFHVPVLLSVMVFMVAVRLQSMDRFTVDGTVYLSGNDAWYHLRQVQYTVSNWPATMPFDPWTYFPYGTSAGQFGTLYDQLVATAALVVGLGAPGTDLVAKTLLVAPAVAGALAVVPTYYIGRRLAGRVAGLFGAVVLALLPGTFLQRTLVGFADHNGVEPVFQAAAVLALLVAFAVAEREKPVWELVADRDTDALRRPLLTSALAGVAVALYMWVWPPGVLLVGILGVFLVVAIASRVVGGRSPEPIAFAGAVAAGVTGLLMFVPLQQLDVSVTDFSLIQPLFSFAVAGGAVFLAWLARQWERREVDPSLFPAAVFGLVAVGFGLLSAVAPSVADTIVNNLLRTVGFSQGASARTIGEAQPYLAQSVLQQSAVDATGRILVDYGFTLFTGAAAAVWLVAKPLVDEGDSLRIGYVVGGLAVVGSVFLVPDVYGAIGDLVGFDSALVGLLVVAAILVGATLLTTYDSERLFVVVWAAIITSAAFTQVRFNYYLAVVVAVMNAYLFGEVVRYVGFDTLPASVRDVQGYQVIAILAALMLVLAPVLVVPLNVRSTGNAQFDRTSSVWETAQNNAPGDITEWDESLRWMANETPEEGELGGASNGMTYYGTYERTEDFAYPEGSYGVQSWWDYGHWITVRGERIPNANPFQQGATEAANYLLAPSEQQAEQVLARQSTEGNETRFVMVDWKMVSPNSKFGAPVVFYDESNVSREEFIGPVYTPNFRGSVTLRDQRYYESQMVRLYHFHGSAVEPRPVVVDWENRQAQTQSGESISVRVLPDGDQSAVRQFRNMSQAREYVEQDGSAQVGGLGALPSERVPALQHYRLVKVSNQSAFSSASYRNQFLLAQQLTGYPANQMFQTQPAWLKTFERVPGARIDGSGAPPNTTVTAAVELRIPTSNSTFTYRQQTRTNADGEFTMTLPYSSTGYEDYGPENGYTNVSVRATGPYTFTTPSELARVNGSAGVEQYRATAAIKEGQVNGDEDGPVQVELERQTNQLTLGGDDSGSDSNGDGSSTGADSGSSGGDSTTSDDGQSKIEVTVAAVHRG